MQDDTVAALKEIAAQVDRCRLCKLGTGKARGVPGEGNPHADVMMVGEAPGFYEDQQGRPFDGPAGQLLDELQKVAGMARKDVFITNVVKHRPPGNRDPEADELEACDAYLKAQIAAIHPKVIVTLGRFSLAKFMPGVKAMRDVHGRAMTIGDLTVCAMYHPAAALHQQSLRSVLEQDFRNLPAMIARVGSRQAAPESAAVDEPPDDPAPEQMSLF
ncbi:MAG: uracil-DNA glycosylase [Chloroflexota bacterium]|nr:uracil-DNA glycosylase [Chloroflexota bacterium]